MSLTDDIARFLGLPERDIVRIIATAPRRYKIYAIPKRDGIGSRIIAQPARELKAIQRYIIGHFLNELPIHSAATAYVKGRSIRDNAAAHRRSRVILKLDFKEFFHSLRYRDLEAVLVRNNFQAIHRSEWRILDSLLFWRNPLSGDRCLSIGAPSSPLVSNTIMERMDRAFFEAATSSGVVYTRYADDITLSADNIETLLEVEKSCRKIVSRTRRPTLEFNEAKRGIYTSAGRRLITGLVITPNKKISLGRSRKRAISAAIHHILEGKNRSMQHIANTKGWLAFAFSVEPQFVAAMQRKYGVIVDQIIRTEVPRRELTAK